MNAVIFVWTLAGLMNSIFPAAGLDLTLTRKYSRLHTCLAWLIFLVSNFALNFLLYKLFLFDDTRMAVCSILILLLGAITLYSEPVESKLFLSFCLYLTVTVITFMFCGTTDTIFGGKLGLFDPVYGPYTIKNILFFIGLKLIVFTIAHCIYIFLFRDKLKNMMDQAGKKLAFYLSGPVICLLAFYTIMYTTNAIGIMPASFSFFLLYLPICTVFIIDFVHIYTSIKWDTEAVKAGLLVRLDTLTGLQNKTAFSEAGERYDKAIRSKEANFAVVIFDLNNLKRINDTNGHAKGDMALKITADYIQIVFTDCEAFRIGGDEFAVIVNDSSKISILGDMVNEFTALLSGIQDSENWRHVSAAVGYAKYLNDPDFQSVFNRADQLMYENKSITKKALEAADQ